MNLIDKVIKELRDKAKHDWYHFDPKSKRFTGLARMHFFPEIESFLESKLQQVISETREETIEEFWDVYQTAASTDDCSDAECVVRHLKYLREQSNK